MKASLPVFLLLTIVLILGAMQSRRLTKADLQIKGAHLGMNEDEVSLLPGYSIGNGRFQNGFYRKFKDAYVFFNSKGTVFAVRVTGPSYPTYRGLRVGERAPKALKLYGPPTTRSRSDEGTPDEYWTYVYPSDTSLGMMLSFVDTPSFKISDTIRSIVVGKLSLD
jgi:hypothetical protein